MLTGRVGRIAYGLGNFGKAFFYYSVGAYIVFFYVDVVGLDPNLMAVALSIPYGIWNAVNDPLMGFISDRLRTRWGRRIPLIIVGAPLTLLFFWLLWSPWIIGKSDTIIFYYLMFSLAFFDLFLTMLTTGYEALFPEMFEDLKERSEASLYRELFALLGVITGFALFPYVRSVFSAFLDVLNAWSFSSLMLGGIGALTIFISLLGCRERKEFYEVDKPLDLIEMVKLTLGNRTFLAFLGADIVIFFLWSWVPAMIPFYTKYVLKGGEELNALILGVMLLSAIFWWPFLRKITLKVGSKRMFIISTVIFVLSLQPLLLLSDLNLILLAMMFVGCGNAGIQLVRSICLSDVIDEDELKTGVRREGAYIGTMIFFERLMYILLGVISAYLFEVIGYTPDMSPTPSVETGFRASVSLIPLLALFAFLVFMKFYPIGVKEAERITKEKLKLHAIKAEKAKSKS